MSTSVTATLVSRADSSKQDARSIAGLHLPVFVGDGRAMRVRRVEVVQRLAEIEPAIDDRQRRAHRGARLASADRDVGGVAVGMLERDLQPPVLERRDLRGDVGRHEVVVLRQDDRVPRDPERPGEDDVVALRVVALLVQIRLEDPDATLAAFLDGVGRCARM